MNRNDPPPPVPQAELPPDAPRGLVARFRNYFLTGLVVAGPIAITFYLTWWFVNWVDSLVRPFVPLADRPDAGGSRRKTARAHARGARDLSRPQTGVRDVVLRPRIELSPGWPRRVSLAGDVVDRADLAGAERRGRDQYSWRGRTYFGVPALRAEPHHRLFLLRAQKQDHRSGNEHRGRRDPHHVLRRGPARLRPAKETCSLGRNGECRAGRECVRAASGTGEGGVRAAIWIASLRSQ